MPEKLAIPPMPEELVYLWKWFLELDATRGSNGFGINPISYTEISAWAALLDRRPEAWEVKVLKRFDIARIKVANEK